MKKLFLVLILFLTLSSCKENNYQAQIITPENYQLVEKLGQLDDIEYSSLHLSPDGKFLAATSPSGLYIYDIDTLELKQFFDSEISDITFIEWSPTGKFIAFQGSDNQIILKDLFGKDGPWFNGVIEFEFSPSGKYIALLLENEKIYIWGLQREKGPLRVLDLNLSNSILSWSSDENDLAILTDDNYLTILNIKSGETKFSEILSFGKRGNIAWSPDGTKLAISHLETTIILETNTLEKVVELDRYGGDEMPVRELIWSDDGTYLATINFPFASFNIWDTTTWEPLNDWQSEVIFNSSSSIPDSITSVDWHQLNNQIVFASAGYPRIGIWDVSLEKIIYIDKAEEYYSSAIWNKAGTRIISIVHDSGFIYIWGIP